jgi:hypothetical protein
MVRRAIEESKKKLRSSSSSLEKKKEDINQAFRAFGRQAYHMGEGQAQGKGYDETPLENRVDSRDRARHWRKRESTRSSSSAATG